MAPQNSLRVHGGGWIGGGEGGNSHIVEQKSCSSSAGQGGTLVTTGCAYILAAAFSKPGRSCAFAAGSSRRELSSSPLSASCDSQQKSVRNDTRTHECLQGLTGLRALVRPGESVDCVTKCRIVCPGGSRSVRCCSHRSNTKV